MRRALFLVLALISALSISCSSGSTNSSGSSGSASTKTTQASTPTPPPHPKNGDYTAKGKVTKINTDLGSVELDHEDVPGLMPPMIMEFYVDDKSVLKQIAVGDNVDFTIKYKDGQETISKIAKSK